MDAAASGIMLEATATQGRDSSGSYEGVIAPVRPASKVATLEDYLFVIEDILRMLQEPRSKYWLAEELSVLPLYPATSSSVQAQERIAVYRLRNESAEVVRIHHERKTGGKRERWRNR